MLYHQKANLNDFQGEKVVICVMLNVTTYFWVIFTRVYFFLFFVVTMVKFKKVLHILALLGCSVSVYLLLSALLEAFSFVRQVQTPRDICCMQHPKVIYLSD